jgi:hypothetical protein
MIRPVPADFEIDLAISTSLLFPWPNLGPDEQLDWDT